MIEYYFKTTKDDEFVQLPGPRMGCWIHVDDATTNDINEICHLSGLELTDLQDSLDRYEIPRIEKIHHHVLIFTRHPIEADVAVGLYTNTLTILITSHYFITISPQKNAIIRNFLGKKTKLSTVQRSKLMIHLFLKIVQEFNSQIRRVRYNVLNQEKEMTNVESEEISVLTRHEEILNQYLSCFVPMRRVLEELTSGRFTHLYEKDHDLLVDLLNAINQSEDLCTIVVKTICSLRNSYQIIFTNNLHRTIKLLTALTIILNIPTMIASIYGMNVGLPLAHEPHAFLLIMFIIVIISIIGLVIFQRKRWL